MVVIRSKNTDKAKIQPHNIMISVMLKLISGHEARSVKYIPLMRLCGIYRRESNWKSKHEVAERHEQALQ